MPNNEQHPQYMLSAFICRGQYKNPAQILLRIDHPRNVLAMLEKVRVINTIREMVLEKD